MTYLQRQGGVIVQRRGDGLEEGERQLALAVGVACVCFGCVCVCVCLDGWIGWVGLHVHTYIHAQHVHINNTP